MSPDLRPAPKHISFGYLLHLAATIISTQRKPASGPEVSAPAECIEDHPHLQEKRFV